MGTFLYLFLTVRNASVSNTIFFKYIRYFKSTLLTLYRALKSPDVQLFLVKDPLLEASFVDVMIGGWMPASAPSALKDPTDPLIRSGLSCEVLPLCCESVPGAVEPGKSPASPEAIPPPAAPDVV